MGKGHIQLLLTDKAEITVQKSDKPLFSIYFAAALNDTI